MAPFIFFNKLLTNNKMKNKILNFVPLILGIMLGIAIMTILSFTSPSPTPLPQSSSKICSVGTGVAYRLNVDGSQYIVIISSTGTAIVKHR